MRIKILTNESVRKGSSGEIEIFNLWALRVGKRGGGDWQGIRKP